MEILPQPDIVYLEFPKAEAGVLDTSSRTSATEVAKVVSVGKGVEGLNAGDTVFVKSWAVDSISYEDKEYRFCNVKTNGILAVVR